MIGRYFGEKKEHEIAELLVSASKLLIFFNLVMALVLALNASWIIPLLSNETVIQNWFSLAIWIIPFSYAPLGLCMLVVSVFNAFGRPKTALRVSIARLFLFYVPAVWFGASTGDIVNVIYSVFIANTLAGAYAWFTLSKTIITPTSTAQPIEA